MKPHHRTPIRMLLPIVRELARVIVLLCIRELCIRETRTALHASPDALFAVLSGHHSWGGACAGNPAAVSLALPRVGRTSHLLQALRRPWLDMCIHVRDMQVGVEETRGNLGQLQFRLLRTAHCIRLHIALILLPRGIAAAPPSSSPACCA